uniref:CHD1 helical C-terminal domain containing 1 n=1 Tax=Salvator merianae TaxID=96440 RepID=A0A8D0DPI0_SALMN
MSKGHIICRKKQGEIEVPLSLIDKCYWKPPVTSFSCFPETLLQRERRFRRQVPQTLCEIWKCDWGGGRERGREPSLRLCEPLQATKTHSLSCGTRFGTIMAADETPTKASNSGDTLVQCADGLTQDTFKICKEFLRPFKKNLRKLNLPKDFPKEKRLSFIQKNLTVLGDHINVFLQHYCKKWEIHHWKKMLWKFVSLFSAFDEKWLCKMYRYSKTNQAGKFLVSCGTAAPEMETPGRQEDAGEVEPRLSVVPKPQTAHWKCQEEKEGSGAETVNVPPWEVEGHRFNSQQLLGSRRWQPTCLLKHAESVISLWQCCQAFGA